MFFYASKFSQKEKYYDSISQTRPFVVDSGPCVAGGTTELVDEAGDTPLFQPSKTHAHDRLGLPSPTVRLLGLDSINKPSDTHKECRRVSARWHLSCPPRAPQW